MASRSLLSAVAPQLDVHLCQHEPQFALGAGVVTGSIAHRSGTLEAGLQHRHRIIHQAGLAQHAAQLAIDREPRSLLIREEPVALDGDGALLGVAGAEAVQGLERRRPLLPSEQAVDLQQTQPLGPGALGQRTHGIEEHWPLLGIASQQPAQQFLGARLAVVAALELGHPAHHPGGIGHAAQSALQQFAHGAGLVGLGHRMLQVGERALGFAAIQVQLPQSTVRVGERLAVQHRLEFGEELRPAFREAAGEIGDQPAGPPRVPGGPQGAGEGQPEVGILRVAIPLGLERRQHLQRRSAAAAPVPGPASHTPRSRLPRRRSSKPSRTRAGAFFSSLSA